MKRFSFPLSVWKWMRNLLLWVFVKSAEFKFSGFKNTQTKRPSLEVWFWSEHKETRTSSVGLHDLVAEPHKADNFTCDMDVLSRKQTLRQKIVANCWWWPCFLLLKETCFSRPRNSLRSNCRPFSIKFYTGGLRPVGSKMTTAGTDQTTCVTITQHHSQQDETTLSVSAF